MLRDVVWNKSNANFILSVLITITRKRTGLNFDKFLLKGVHKDLFSTRNLGNHLGLRLKMKPKEAIGDDQSHSLREAD
jgi:hypothetical protein